MYTIIVSLTCGRGCGLQALFRVPCKSAVPEDLVNCQQRCKSAAHDLYVLRSLETELLALC